MSDPTIPFAIAGSAAFGIGIMTLAFRVRSYTPARPWSDFRDRPHRDQQYRDRVAAGAQSFRDALALSDNECAEYVSANSDKPIAQFTKWPEVTEDKILKLHGGEQ